MAGRFSLLRICQLKRWHIVSLMDGMDDVTYDYLQLLYYIEQHPECTQKDISVAFAISKALLTRNIKFMEKKGLIERTVNEDDERSYHLNVTEKGRDLYASCMESLLQVEAKQFAGFSPEEKAQYESYIDRIIENLETDRSRGRTIAQINGKLSRRGAKK